MKKNLTIGILAHVDAGKTTLSEGFLFVSGAIRKLGRVDHKDAFLDTYELERSRGITIFSKQAVFEYGDTRFTLLDTPGHTDFSPEMERTLQILDVAVLIISAADAVTSQVRLLWKLLKHYNIPVFIFVNKMDQQGADKKALLSSLKSSLSPHCVDFQAPPESMDFQEELAVCDDDLLSSFLEGSPVTEDDIRSLIMGRKCFPCLFGSALKLEGVKELLDLLSEYSSCPSFSSKEFSGRVFKISRDANGTRLTHMKILSGMIKVRDLINDEKVDQIRIYSGEKFETITEATAGMVVAVTGLSKTAAGQGLGAASAAASLKLIQPVLSCSLILPEGTDTIVFYKKLKALEEEEPMLNLSLNENTGEINIKVMGEVQKQILAHLIKTRLGTDVSFGPGQIIYKETIAGSVEGVGHFEPLRHYAEVHLLLEPAEPGSGIIIDNKCSTDELALNWQRLILTHIQEKKHVGVLTGSELTDVKITLLTGRAHEKHTEGGDFRQATYRAIRQGLMMGESVLLEPVFDYRLEVPQENVGRVLSDMQRMNATVTIPEIEGNKAVVTGTVPASCLSDYGGVLASFTHGDGNISTTLRGYAPCHNTQEILDKYQYFPELDTDNPSSSVFCSHGAGTVIPFDEVRNYMHLESGWSKESAANTSTDLTDSIDMEALKKLQAKKTKSSDDNRSFDEIQREIRVTENELKNIFERTYGTIKPRYVESDAQRQKYEAKALDEKLGISSQPDADVTLSAKKQNSKKDTVLKERQKEYLLVDGYNVIYASPQLKSLAQTDLKAARDKLVDILINFQGYRREQVILVFDAYKVRGGTEHLEEHSGLTVIYTREAETADQYIEKAAHEIGKKHRVTVATSDAIEQVIVMSSGAIRLSANDFWAEIQRTDELIREHI